MFYGALGVFEVLDEWFSIRYEISGRRLKSDFFATNFVQVNPSEVEWLEENHYADNTVIVVLGDHHYWGGLGKGICLVVCSMHSAFQTLKDLLLSFHDVSQPLTGPRLMLNLQRQMHASHADYWDIVLKR